MPTRKTLPKEPEGTIADQSAEVHALQVPDFMVYDSPEMPYPWADGSEREEILDRFLYNWKEALVFYQPANLCQGCGGGCQFCEEKVDCHQRRR